MRQAISFGFSILFGLTTAVSAQDRPNTILVMDGSGSMWGQIDGIAKITIAQDVMGDLLNTLPEEQSLGLIAYGHRERGNCTDIELLIEPGPARRDAIAAAVDEISPLGKTPMTDSVIAAAEALRYTEDSATVILVSDGVETCNPDPCAAARILEETGVDFTAHVIGFDVGGDAEATAQMQCIAEETGGMFIPAADAGELAEALTTVVEEPEPVTVTMTFQAVIGDDLRLLESPVLWDINASATQVVEGLQDNPLSYDLEEGAYLATAYSLELEQSVEVSFVAIDGGENTVRAVFEEPALTARLLAPESVQGGTSLPVGWEGPNDQYDNVQIFPAGDDRNRYDFLYTERGNPLEFIAPFHAGNYELRYEHKDAETIGTATFVVTEAPVGLEAPAEVPVASDFDVTWIGPGANGDNIQIGPVGETRYTNYRYTDDGNIVTLKAPPEPGDYELRYSFRDREIIYTQPIKVVDVLATVTAPAEAVAGSSIAVDWTGPAGDGDYIGIGQVVATSSQQWKNYTYVSEGAPLSLLVPMTPGDYLVSYFLQGGQRVLASQQLSVIPVSASITVPSEAIAGSTVPLSWTGPDYDGDYIGIGKAGASGAEQWENYAYTRDGETLGILVPTEPGDYVLTYFAAQDRTPLATAKISVTTAKATVTAPATATAGDTIAVDWFGPDYDGDYIGIGHVDATGADQWKNYAYTRDGGPSAIVVPITAGEYRISYFSGQDRSILASTTLMVADVAASLTAPPTATAGSTIPVEWMGPAYDGDYIGIGRADATNADQWENYAYTENGTPVSLLVPTTPGDYVISYFARQDRAILASTKIVVEDLSASISGPTTAVAGSTIAVDWVGPKYDGDYLGIGAVGASGSNQWQNYADTDDGSPASILVPMTPGEYQIRYFVRQDRSVLAEATITVTEATATVDAPQTAIAGETISVAWTGPNYSADYIGIGPAGETGGARWQNYASTGDGSPVSLLVPPTPGEYTITYFARQDRTPLKSVPITVQPIESVQLLAADTAPAGGEIIVGWDGPAYDGDYIGIGKVGATGGSQWETYRNVSTGNPVTIAVPDEAGDYLITYFLRQDRMAVKSRPLTVE